MKKTLITTLAMLVATAFVGCTSDYNYTSYYIYTNNSSREVILKTYIYDYPKDNYSAGHYLEDPEFSFRISIGESRTLRFDAEGGYPDPFYWYGTYADYLCAWRSPNSTDSLNVSNGQKYFGNTRYSATDEDKLFQEKNYEIIEINEKDRDRTYLYVFTDKDFENATPIEE